MAQKGECPAPTWAVLFGICVCDLDVWRDLSSPEIPATAEVARELRRLGDALYWRYKLVELLTKNYTAVAKVKWGRAGGKIKAHLCSI